MIPELKRRARYRAAYAHRGERSGAKCEVCGSQTDLEMHHDDYEKPLEIRWLCFRHHLEADGKFDRTLTLPWNPPTGSSPSACILREAMELIQQLKNGVAPSSLGKTVNP